MKAKNSPTKNSPMKAMKARKAMMKAKAWGPAAFATRSYTKEWVGVYKDKDGGEHHCLSVQRSGCGKWVENWVWVAQIGTCMPSQ
jgi:hypothetical protein